MFSGPSGTGKCVSLDTYIYTKKGLVKLGSVSGNRESDTFSDLNMEIASTNGVNIANKYYYNGFQPTITIITKKGYSLTGTYVHPILVINKYGDMEFRKLGDLLEQGLDDVYIPLLSPNLFPDNNPDISSFKYIRKKGDSSESVYLNRAIPKEMSIELAELMGIIVGDGCICPKNKSVDISSDIGIDPDMEGFIIGRFEKLFNYKPRITYDKRRIEYSKGRWKIKLVRFSLGYKKALHFFEYVGVKRVTAEFKEVPWSVMMSTKEIQSAFLRGYFEADGYCGDIRKNGKKNRIIECASKSEKLIRQVHLMLLNFGVVSTIIKRFNKKYKKHYWYISISGENVKFYSREIGFISHRKCGILLKNSDTVAFGKGGFDIIPNQMVRIRNIQNDLRGNFKDAKERFYGNLLWGNGSGHNHITKSRVFDFIKDTNGECFNSKSFAELYNMALLPYVYDKPVSIMDSGIKEVGDLCVPGFHSFCSNGFMSHNTTNGRIFAKAILCDSPVDGNPCCKCESCISFAQEKHFGYNEMDAASFGGKDDMIKLRDDAAFQSMSKKKIILLDECHDISKQGQDALLKQVEQCPDHLIYIFCTTDPYSMKETLRNRCTEFQISKVNQELIVKRLKIICEKEKINCDEDALKMISNKSGGHVRNAIKILEEVSYLGNITVDGIKSILKDYENEIFSIISNLGVDLQKALEAYKIVSAYLSPSELYGNILSMVNDASKLLYGYNDFIPQRKELLEKLKDIHGYSLMEFMNYLMQRDKYVDKIGIQSDIVLLHYKFSINSFSPHQQQKVYAPAPMQAQSVTIQKNEPEAADNKPPLDYTQLSKMSVTDKARVLRELRQNKSVETKEEAERVLSEWPLPKEERLGESSMDDEALSPQEFSQHLVGGRGGI
jgi:DNA polymerase III subunit gamma/tau